MSTAYPGGLDNFNNPTGANNLSDTPVLHHSQHTNVNDAVKAIETELGTNPKGANTSVRARIEAIEAAQAGFQVASQKGAANGYAGLDAGGLLAQNVDASKVASGTLNAARIPNLDVAKITTGVFNIARIPVIPLATGVSGTLPAASLPNHSAALITSGTLDANRIPSSVAANANSRVVADVGARDSIPLGERTNGLIVTVLNPFTQYTWRSDNSSWNQSGGPGGISEDSLEAYDATTLTTSIVTFDPGAPGLSQVFAAPWSGKVHITLSSLIIITVGTGAGYFGAEVRAGASIGSGTIIDSVATQKCCAVGGATGIRSGGSIRYKVGGLTPGNTYHVRTMFTTSSSPTATMQLFYRRLLVEMVH